MNKILLGSVALAAIVAGPAMAADMRVPPRTFAPAKSWTGFYVGGNVGGVWGNTDPGFIASCGPDQAVTALGAASNSGAISSGFLLPPAGFGIPTCYTAGLSSIIPPGSAAATAAASAAALNAAAAAGNSQLTQVGTDPFRNKGWTGGGQLGFNYQYQWAVFGLEADFQAWNPKGTKNSTGTYQLLPGALPCNAATGAAGGVINASSFGGCQFGFTESSSGRWLTTVRGKVGAVWNDWMVYGTMGVAWARMSFASSFADNTCAATFASGAGVLGCNAASFLSVRQTKVGFAGGAGLSYMLTNHIIVSVEYLYVEVSGYGGDTKAVTFANTCATLPGTCGAGAAGVPVGTYSTNFHYDAMFKENTLRLKLDYKL